MNCLMKAIQFGAAGQVQDDEPAAGLEGGGEVVESGGLVAEMREGVEAEHAVELAGRHGFGADVEKEKLDREAAAAGFGKHAGGEVHGDDPAGSDGVGEPAAKLAGAAADFEQIVAGEDTEAAVEFGQAAKGIGRVRALSVPAGGELVEKGDARVSGFDKTACNHTILVLRNTDKGRITQGHERNTIWKTQSSDRRPRADCVFNGRNGQGGDAFKLAGGGQQRHQRLGWVCAF